MRAFQIEIGTHERRPAQGCQDAAFPGRFPGHGLADCRPNTGRLRVVFGETFREGANQRPIGIESEDLKAGYAAVIETLAVGLQRAILRWAAHARAPWHSRTYIQRVVAGKA